MFNHSSYSVHQAEAKLTEIHVSLVKATKSYNKSAWAHALARGTITRSYKILKHSQWFGKEY